MHLVISQKMNPCIACKASYGKTCCEVKEGDGASLPMTVVEAERIADKIDKPIHEAVIAKAVSIVSEFDGLGKIDFRLVKMVKGGVGLFLPRRFDGSCVYLGGEGCTIPKEKPTVCSLFPFNKVNGQWRIGSFVEDPGFCLAQDTSTTVDTALRMFGLQTKVLDTFDRQWNEDLLTHAVGMRKLGLWGGK